MRIMTVARRIESQRRIVVNASMQKKGIMGMRGQSLPWGVAMLVAAALLLAACGGAERPTAKKTPTTTLTPAPTPTAPPSFARAPRVVRGKLRIAFSGNRSKRNDLDIYVVSPDGSGLRRVVGLPGHDRTPVWSPDGSRIAFINGDIPEGERVAHL